MFSLFVCSWCAPRHVYWYIYVLHPRGWMNTRIWGMVYGQMYALYIYTISGSFLRGIFCKVRPSPASCHLGRKTDASVEHTADIVFLPRPSSKAWYTTPTSILSLSPPRPSFPSFSPYAFRSPEILRNTVAIFSSSSSSPSDLLVF